MGCKCATYDPDIGRYQCSVSGSECMYYFPDSKKCARDYGEGPDSVTERDEQIAIRIIDEFNAAGIAYGIDPVDGTICYTTDADKERGEEIIKRIEREE